MKKNIEIRLISKAFNGMLSKDGESVYGDGFIRKIILQKEMVNPTGSLRMLEISNTCKEVTGVEPVINTFLSDNKKDVFDAKINGRLSFLIIVDR